MRRDSCFGAGIVWGTIPTGFPVPWVAVPGCSRNDYGTSPNLWVQKKFVKFRQRTQNTWLRTAEFFWKFLVTLPSISFETWEMYSWVIPGSSVFCDWLLLLFQVFLSKLLLIFSYSSKLPWCWGKSFVSSEDWIAVLFFNQQWESPLIVREKDFNKCKQLKWF